MAQTDTPISPSPIVSAERMSASTIRMPPIYCRLLRGVANHYHLKTVNSGYPTVNIAR